MSLFLNKYDTKKVIILAEEISDEHSAKFSERLYELERDKKSTTVFIELCSPGGDAYSALAYASRLRNSRLNIVVYASGLVASAAVLVLAYGDYRLMTKEAWVMVHEDSGKLKGDVKKLEKDVEHMRRMERQWCELLRNKTRISSIEWGKLHKQETYLTADDCLLYGLVDEIV